MEGSPVSKLLGGGGSVSRYWSHDATRGLLQLMYSAQFM